MSLDIKDFIEIQKKQWAKESNNKGAMSAEEIISKLEEFKNINTQIWWSLSQIFSKQDLDIILQVIERLKTVWTVFFKIFLLSLCYGKFR